MTIPSREELDAQIRLAGLSVSPAQLDDIHAGWTLLEPLLMRIRANLDTGNLRAPVTASAAIFRADSWRSILDDKART